MMREVQIAAALIAVALVGGSVLSHPAYAQTKRIVFLAGLDDHGGPGRHEYEKDQRVLPNCLENFSNLEGVTTEAFVGTAPKDINELRNAAVIAANSSSDRFLEAQNPPFPPDADTDHDKYDPETMEYLKALTGLTDKGVGVAVFHCPLRAEDFTARRRWLCWLSGRHGVAGGGVQSTLTDEVMK